MKTLLKVLVALMVGSLLVLFMKPSFTYLLTGWHGFEAIMIKVAISCAVILAFGYYAVLLWKEHGPHHPTPGHPAP